MTESTLAGDRHDELVMHTYAERAYLDYAVAVVKGRALAQVQDGLKPVQRRILYAMNEMGLRHDSKPVKSARIVGDVLGKYHPHGDAACYDAAVRMAQDFTLRYPIIHGQGNFGSRDGDTAAAMRYTEARLTPIAQLLLSEIHMETVDFEENYDNTLQEPSLLPARLPFLLLNGTSGIAVGMAAEIPPHNLREVAEAAVLVIEKPDATDDELFATLPAPDFPDGGQVVSSSADIAKAYTTGRGSIRVRARWEREELARGQWQVVVTQLPYRVSTKTILEEIEALTNPQPPAGKKTITPQQATLKAAALEFLERAVDESDKENPVRLVLSPRTSKVDMDAMMTFLLANTSLETNVPVNMTVVGLDGRPQLKSLRQILGEWGEFRIETVRRRTAFELKRALARIHILEGRMTVFLNLDAVIKVIREADDPKAELQQAFGLSEVQADDILEMRLRALNKLEGIKLERELDELRMEADRCRKLLDSGKALRRQVVTEIRADAEKYGDDRRTLVKAEARAASSASAAIIKAAVDEDLTVVLTKNLFIRAYKGHDVQEDAFAVKAGDGVMSVARTRSTWPLVVLDANGRAYTVDVTQVPASRGDGVPLTTLIELQDNARVVAMLGAQPQTRYLFAGANGYGFLAQLEHLVASRRAGKAFLKLEAGESPMLPVPVPATDTGYVACGTSDGRLLLFPLGEVKTLAAGGKGVMLVGLADGQTVSAIRHVEDLAVFEGTCLVKGAPTGFRLKGDELQKHVGHRARKGCQLPKKSVMVG